MIKFESKLNSNLTMQATKQTMKRLWWLYTIFSLCFVTVGLIGILFREDDADLSFGIFLVIFGVSFFPVCFVLTKLLQKRLDKSTPMLSENTEETFVFDSDIVTIEQRKSEMFFSHTEAAYSYFYKIIESSTHYFLYVSKVQMHVIPKDSLTEGSLEELNGILENKMGVKFKKRAKNTQKQ